MKVTKGTIVRTIAIGVVVINYGLKACGINVIPYDENAVASSVEAVASIAAIAASWWYNNSFSEKAKVADKVFEALNKGQAVEVSNDAGKFVVSVKGDEVCHK